MPPVLAHLTCRKDFVALLSEIEKAFATPELGLPEAKEFSWKTLTVLPLYVGTRGRASIGFRCCSDVPRPELG